MARSLLPPSGAAIWGAPDGCTMWSHMRVKHTSPMSDAATDGIRAHDVARRILAGAAPTVEDSDDMIWAAGVYKEAVLSEVHPDLTVTESAVTAASIHPDCRGYVDLYSMGPDDIWIWDYKYGMHPVEVRECWQLLVYAIALYDEMGAAHPMRIHMRIVQPRAYHREGPVRGWDVSSDDLRPYRNLLQSAATQVYTDPQYRAGAQCRWCPGRHECPVAREVAMSGHDACTDHVPPTEPAVLGAELSKVRQAIEALRYLESAYEEQVSAALRRGVPVPGWRLGRSRSRKEWSADPEQIINMGDMLGIDLRTPTKAITPVQACDSGMPTDVIDVLTTTILGRETLTTDDVDPLGVDPKEIFND